VCFKKAARGRFFFPPARNVEAVIVETGLIATLRLLFARQAKGKRKLVLSRCFNNYPSSLYKIDYFSSSDCRIINSHEGQEAYSQTDTRHTLSDLWRGAGREVRTQHRTAPNSPEQRRIVTDA
jgi:hypothetical protein